MTVSNAQLFFNRLVQADDNVSFQLSQPSEVGGQTAEYLAEHLHQSFVKKGQKQYCSFETDSQILAALTDGQSIQDISAIIGERLVQFIDPEAAPAENILVLAKYRYLASEYLLCVMLGVKDSVQLVDNINPARSQILDIANLSLAVQLDISELEINPDTLKGVAYIKGRVGRQVNDFMAQTFQIETKVNSKEATQQLVTQVEDFIATQVDDKEATAAVREVTLETMKSAAESGDFMQVKELSEEIEQATGIAGFYDSVAETEDFAEELPVYMAASKSLQKIFGQGGGMSISFDRKLMGEYVHFDKQSQSLTFTKLPPNLLDALNKSSD